MKDKQAVGRQVEDESVPGGLWAFQGVGAETRVGEKVKKKKSWRVFFKLCSLVQ